MTKEITRIKKSETKVPKSLFQAELLLGQIGTDQKRINAIESELKTQIEKLKKEAGKKLNPLVSRRGRMINALFAFANPRKEELTEKVRSVVLGTGIFGWRMSTPRVEIDGSEEDIIAILKDMDQDRFVRVIEELDRQALLAERPSIPRIGYRQNDEFFVVPKMDGRKKKTFTKTIDRENGK